MKTINIDDVSADLDALCESISTGVPAEPGVAERVRERAELVRTRLSVNGPLDVAVDLVREARDE